MGGVSFDQIMNSGSNTSMPYFTLQSGQETQVRFLYNNTSEIKGYYVHEFTNNNRTTRVVCACNEGEQQECKWCQQSGRSVLRCWIPVFNVQKNRVEYWTRTGSWVRDELVPQVSEVENVGKSIASQIYKVKRQGSGLDTKYTLIAMGQPDNINADSYGQLLDPCEQGVIKPYDYELQYQQPNSNNGQVNNNFNPNNNGFNTNNYMQQPNNMNQNNNFGGNYNPNNNFNPNANYGGNDNNFGNIPPATRKVF